MATLVLGAVGAVAGSLATGGPWTAWKGFQVGAAIGSLIDGANQPGGEVGKLADRRFTGSSYGAGIPRIWGRVRVGGIVIWCQEDAKGNHLVEHKHHVGGGGSGLGGGGGTEYWYSSTFAVAVAQGTIVASNGDLLHRSPALRRLYADDKIVYDLDEWTAHAKAILKPTSDFDFFAGTETQSPSSVIVAASGLASSHVCAFRGLTYFVVLDMDLRDHGNRLPNWSAELETDAVTVGDIVSDLAREAGLEASQIDVTAATRTVTGALVSDVAAPEDAIQAICDFYGYDVVEVDMVLRLVDRGGASIATLSSTELGAASGGGKAPRMKRTRANAAGKPTRVEVGYFDVDNALQAGLQGDSDLGGTPNTSTIDLPLSLTAAEAIQAAKRKLDEALAAEEEVSLSLSMDRLKIAPGDVVTVPVAGTARRVRVTKSAIAPIGEVRITGVLDDDAAITQSTDGGSTGGGTAPPPGTPVPSVWVAWSGTELRDVDRASAGFYVAATGGDGWTGGTIYYSTDESTWISGGGVRARSSFGETTSTLSSSGAVANIYDDANDVDVDLGVSDGSLASASDDEIASGLNHALVGDELLGFGTANLTAPNEYTLSHLRRGERGTPMSGHATGEMFVALSDAIARVEVSDSLVGSTVYVRVVSAYETIDDVASSTLVVAARTPTDGESALATLVRPYFVAPIDVENQTAGKSQYAWTTYDATSDIPVGAVAVLLSIFWSDTGNTKTITIQGRKDSGGATYDLAKAHLQDDPDASGFSHGVLLPLHSTGSERSFQHRLVDGDVSNDYRIQIVGYWAP